MSEGEEMIIKKKYRKIAEIDKYFFALKQKKQKITEFEYMYTIYLHRIN